MTADCKENLHLKHKRISCFPYNELTNIYYIKEKLLEEILFVRSDFSLHFKQVRTLCIHVILSKVLQFQKCVLWQSSVSHFNQVLLLELRWHSLNLLSAGWLQMISIKWGKFLKIWTRSLRELISCLCMNNDTSHLTVNGTIA